MRTDDELKQIAKAFKGGKVYSTQHDGLRNNLDMVTSVFLPLALMNEEQNKEFEAENPIVIFEYLDKASSRSINGLPSFFSFQQLNEEEWDKVAYYHKKLEDAEKAALGG